MTAAPNSGRRTQELTGSRPNQSTAAPQPAGINANCSARWRHRAIRTTVDREPARGRTLQRSRHGPHPATSTIGDHACGAITATRGCPPAESAGREPGPRWRDRRRWRPPRPFRRCRSHRSPWCPSGLILRVALVEEFHLDRSDVRARRDVIAGEIVIGVVAEFAVHHALFVQRHRQPHRHAADQLRPRRARIDDPAGGEHPHHPRHPQLAGVHVDPDLDELRAVGVPAEVLPRLQIGRRVRGDGHALGQRVQRHRHRPGRRPTPGTPCARPTPRTSCRPTRRPPRPAADPSHRSGSRRDRDPPPVPPRPESASRCAHRCRCRSR